MEVAKDKQKHTYCTAAVVRSRATRDRAQPEVGGPPNASQLKEVEPFEQGKTMRIHELCYNMPKSTSKGSSRRRNSSPLDQPNPAKFGIRRLETAQAT